VVVPRSEQTASHEDPGRRVLPADHQGWLACASAVAGFALCLAGWLVGGGEVSLPWAPTLDLHLSLALDGLGVLYGLLATGIGALVFAYGTRYLTLHLEHDGRTAAERWRFWPWMTLFAVAMVGLATAQDLVLLFVFFDVTAVCSYYLIGFDRAERESRAAALMALVVTVVSAVAMLVAAVLLYVAYGTFSIPELLSRVRPGTITTVAAALLAVAALAKSAQVPLHFWLPRAMAAPTPVSAYLHSAAMVAAGVLVIGRVHPLLSRSEAVLGRVAGHRGGVGLPAVPHEPEARRRPDRKPPVNTARRCQPADPSTRPTAGARFASPARWRAGARRRDARGHGAQHVADGRVGAASPRSHTWSRRCPHTQMPVGVSRCLGHSGRAVSGHRRGGYRRRGGKDAAACDRRQEPRRCGRGTAGLLPAHRGGSFRDRRGRRPRAGLGDAATRAGGLTLVRARNVLQRVVALDLLAVLVIALLALLSYARDVGYYLDAAVALSLLSFVATIAAARHVSSGGPFQ
jgi:multisubunit Na+/H+ antiporter MnhF subunit